MAMFIVLHSVQGVMMPIDHEAFVPKDTSLAEIEVSLRATMDRLRSLLDRPLHQDDLVEITAIYNNIAYLFLYLEANSESTKYESLIPWRRAFHEDEALRARILDRIRQLRCADPEAEESRRSYLEQLENHDRVTDPAFEARSTELLAQAKDVIAELRASESALLARLGAGSERGRPVTVLYRLLAATAQGSTREKLQEAWRSVRHRPLRALEALVDEMVAERRARSTRQGYDDVADEAFVKASVQRPTVERFLGSYLDAALHRHDELASEIGVARGRDLAPHFPRYLSKITEAGPAPTFDLHRCLDYVFRVSHAILGLECGVVAEESSSDSLVVDVLRASRRIGRIHLALWNAAHGGPGNHTHGLRNRTDWSGLTQVPVAHVFCGFGTARDGGITFQNVHSLFHEFGHAINHILVRKRISNRAGLEYLPLERLEFLSMWFERWSYHPELVATAIGPDANRRVAACRRTKSLEFERTFLERGVVSALDLELHTSNEGGIRDAFERLLARHRLLGRMHLDDVLEYFTWPMFQAHPGANFTYLWGAAFSAELFLPYMDRPIDEGPSQATATALAPCFDFEHPSPSPSCVGLFRFYRELSRAPDPKDDSVPSASSASHDLLRRAERTRDATMDGILRRSLSHHRLPTIQIDDNTGRALQLLTRLHAPQRILELGTLFGYSTIYLARGLAHDGRITTVESDPRFAEIARANLSEAGVDHRVEVIVADARNHLEGLHDGSFDMILVDADKRSYPYYISRATELLRPGGLLIVDDALARGDFRAEGNAVDPAPAILASVARLLDDDRFLSVFIPSNRGLLVCQKEET